MTAYIERTSTHELFACVWSRVTRAGDAETRVVPDACADVMWHRESGRLFVAGPDTRGYVSPLAPGTLIGVRFRPGRTSAGLGVPAEAVRDIRVDLDSVWQRDRVLRLADELAVSTDDVVAQRLLAAAVAEAAAEPDPAVPALIEWTSQGARVAEIADRIGLTERQVHRRCLAAFGYGPKVLQRVLRFDRAVALARGGLPAAEAAYELGYADQAHLSREVKALAGVPLGVLLSR